MPGIFAILCFVLCVSCQQVNSSPESGSRIDTLHSPAIGDDFTISFKTSDGFDPGKPFTLIYIADASLGLGQYALGEDSAMSAKLPSNTVLVAIGHVNGSNEKRARDFIPSDVTGKKEKGFANADVFYAFLKSQIIPFAEQRFPGAKKRVFIGHSFSGLFSLYAALKNEKLFDEFFAISPSVWANHHELMKIEEAFSKNNSDLNASIHIYAGGLEFLNKVLYSSRRFYHTLLARNYKNLHISFEVIGGANHFSIRKPAIDRIMAALAN
jgi:uncharacterized protein